MTDETFGSDRIRLRLWRDDEADRLFDILSNPDIVRWLGDWFDDPPVMKDRTEAVEKIAAMRQRRADDPRTGAWAIEPVATGVPAGTALLSRLPNGDGEFEIGWQLHPDSHGHGYASEAARLVLAQAFADGHPEIYALTHTTNAASQAVCKRIGMADLGPVRRWYEGESQCFRITRTEWEASQPVR